MESVTNFYRAREEGKNAIDNFYQPPIEDGEMEEGTEEMEQQVTAAPRILVPEVNNIIQEDEYEQPQASAETVNKG